MRRSGKAVEYIISLWVGNSAVECWCEVPVVIGSIPIRPTKEVYMNIFKKVIQILILKIVNSNFMCSQKISKDGEFTTFDTSRGHCGLCGSLTCRGTCFK